MSDRFSLARAGALPALAVPILWTAYIAIPVRGWGWLGGIPLRPLEACLLALVWWGWAARRTLPGSRVLVVLVIAKIALSGTFLDRGFEARYYANESWAPPAERSTEFRSGGFTRRDERLAFGVEGPPDLPLYFFNDNRRFNFYLPTEPRRETLAYSAVWSGFLLIQRNPAPARFYLTADEAAGGELAIDGRQVIVLDRVSDRTGSMRLEPGWHALTIRVSAPYGAGRRVEAGEIISGAMRPFDGSRVLSTPYGTARLAFDTALRWTTWFVDWVVLGAMAWMVIVGAGRTWRDIGVGRWLWFAALAEALRYAWPWAARATMLSGGNDWLTYETYARAILMDDVVRAGQDGPFYYQPLYPYFVALSHLVFGEDLFGIILVQRLLVAATVASIRAITTRLFGTLAGWIAVVLGALFLYEKLGRWSYVLLAEPLFTPVFAAWIWTLVRTATDAASKPRLVISGVVGGIATLTRSTLLLAWPVILPMWWASLRSRRTRALATLLIVMASVVGLATARNWVVAKRFVLVATSFSINLSLGNQPPHPLAPPTPQRTALYERLGFDSNTRGVAEYVTQEPSAFVRGLGRKALYSLGFYEMSGLGVYEGTSWYYVSAWGLALVGIALLLRRPHTQWIPAMWLPLTGALIHLAAVVLIFPYGYGDRLIIPLYPLLIPYAAVALEPLARRMQPYASRGGTVITTAGARYRRRIGSVIRRGLVACIGWANRRALPIVVPPLRQPRTWLYLAYIAAVVQRLDWRAEDADETGLVTALLLPIAALAVAWLTSRQTLHRVVGGVVFAAALVHVASRGSLSPEALHDPLFWGAIAAIALGVSAVTRRWPVAAMLTSAVAGACAMMATLLPRFPDFESSFPPVNLAVARESFSALSSQLGVVATAMLVAVWIHAIALGGERRTSGGHIRAAVRGALVAALVFSLAGAVPTADGLEPVWIAMLGVLLGLA